MINRQHLRSHILALESGDLARKRQTFQALRVWGEDEWAGAPDEAAVALIEVLRGHLQDVEMPFYQKEAATVLGNMGSRAGPAVPQLVDLLRDGIPDTVREAAATALGNIGKLAKAAVAPLARLLPLARSTLSVRAARALGNIGGADEDVRSALIGLWLSPQQIEGGKAQVAIVLCQLGIGTPSLLETLTRTLVASHELSPRMAAAEALAWCNTSDPAVVPALLTAVLGDKNEGVRDAAQAALDRMKLSHEAAVLVCAKQLGETPYAEAALRRSGQKAVPALVKALAAGEAEVRARASRALGGIGEVAAEAAPALAKALSDADPEVRLAAAKGLWDVSSVPDRAVPALVDLLKASGRNGPKGGDVRRMFLQTVMEALGRIGPPATGAIPALTAMTKDDNRHVRETALNALKKIRAA